VISSRISGRRVHEKTGRSYHVKYNPPKVEGLDDFTGEPLIQRQDDNEFTMSRRFQTYRVITAPLLQYYKE
jgi:adenylate kinase